MSSGAVVDGIVVSVIVKVDSVLATGCVDVLESMELLINASDLLMDVVLITDVVSRV